SGDVRAYAVARFTSHYTSGLSSSTVSSSPLRIALHRSMTHTFCQAVRFECIPAAKSEQWRSPERVGVLGALNRIAEQKSCGGFQVVAEHGARRPVDLDGADEQLFLPQLGLGVDLPIGSDDQAARVLVRRQTGVARGEPDRVLGGARDDHRMVDRQL